MKFSFQNDSDVKLFKPMANPLLNADGNVALRWVYQALLVEMTDKTLHALCAT